MGNFSYIKNGAYIALVLFIYILLGRKLVTSKSLVLNSDQSFIKKELWVNNNLFNMCVQCILKKKLLKG